MHVRRKRKRKALHSDKALSVAEVEAMVDREQKEAQIREAEPRPKRRPITCSGCRQQGHNIRNCTKQE